MHTIKERAFMSSAIAAAERLLEPDGQVDRVGVKAGGETLSDTRGTLLSVVPTHDGRSFVAIVGYLLPSPVPSGSGRDRAALDTASGLTIDRDQHRVLLNGREIPLLFQEFELLEFLAARPHRTFTREEILAGAWGGRKQNATTRTVDVHIHRLRRKLGPVYAKYFVTVHRIGYTYRPPRPANRWS
jgi:DNA-binding response OmpR family regulator